MNHCGTKNIETDRLILRRLRIEDAEAMYRNWASDPEVTKFLTWPPHENVEATRGLLTDWVAAYERDDYYQWGIELKSLGEVIGTITVVGMKESIGMAHIGYCIGRSWWHQGVMTEALGAIITFLFEEVKCKRIESRYDVNNPHSGDVMKNCGMTFEGIMRGADVNNQGICDTGQYAILRDDKVLSRPQMKFVVQQITDENEKQRIARDILESLPEWFGIPEARENYIRDSGEQLFFTASKEQRDIGFLCLKETGRDTMELYVMGVLKEYHRQGVGRAMAEKAIRVAGKAGYSFLQVKTVQFGHYDEYDATNRFYLALGFKEFEVFPELWGENNPCQIYVMAL